MPRRIESGAPHTYIFLYAPAKFWKRGVICTYFLLHPGRIWKRGATCKYLLLRPSRIFRSEALYANIFTYAPIGSWAGNYMYNLSSTPRCRLKEMHFIQIFLPQLYLEQRAICCDVLEIF